MSDRKNALGEKVKATEALHANTSIADGVRTHLLSLADEGYKAFHCKLMPGYDEDRVIGVRMPQLRAYAKELIKSGKADAFIESLPHHYYEEDNLHGLIICTIKDYDEQIARLEELLPSVDNWATCDLLKPASFQKNRERLLGDIRRWLDSEETYTVRFGIGMLMAHFLDEDFSPKYLEQVAEIESDEYYINMMRAWYFATALSKQYEASVKLIENRRLDIWTHNKTIQKAVESYRISDEQKQYLKSLKLKKEN